MIVIFRFQLKNAQDLDKKSSLPGDKNHPYFANLNEDPMLSYVICHYLNSNEITIGSRNSTICLNGLNILEQHAVVRRLDSDNYELKPAEVGAKIKINGYNLTGYTQ